MRNIFDDFVYQAKLNQEKIAIIDGDCHVTYHRFLCEIDEIALILSQSGFSSNSVIAIALLPSYQFLLYMFACLKLKITYIPLDANYPLPYIEAILKNAQVSALISKSSLISNINDITLIDIDHFPAKNFPIKHARDDFVMENIAYLIYTSGSTGQPKGVMMQHDNLISLLDATKELFPVTNKDVIPLFHSLAFDLSIWEICFALTNGAKLVIVPPAIKQSVTEYCQFLLQHKASMLTLTPSMLYLILDIFANRAMIDLEEIHLRYVISAGEALYPARIKKWFELPIFKQTILYNMYGITEGTIHSTVRQITKEDTNSDASPIGVPLPNVKVMIIDDNDDVVADNTIGELCLSGRSVTPGYFNAEELNQASFITKKMKDGQEIRFFKTKDLVKMLPSGELEYIERKNRVVKIRGFRISAKQIENQLLISEFVDNAVVTTFLASDNTNRLVAYLQGNQDYIDIVAIRKALKETLPEYMCPNKFIIVDEIPLTINGKTDINALINLQQSPVFNDDSPAEYTIEEKIRKAWQKILNRESIDEEENFFDAGGDSLLLPRLLFILKQDIDERIEIVDLVKFPTIKKLSLYIEKNLRAADLYV